VIDVYLLSSLSLDLLDISLEHLHFSWC